MSYPKILLFLAAGWSVMDLQPFHFAPLGRIETALLIWAYWSMAGAAILIPWLPNRAVTSEHRTE